MEPSAVGLRRHADELSLDISSLRVQHLNKALEVVRFESDYDFIISIGGDAHYSVQSVAGRLQICEISSVHGSVSARTHVSASSAKVAAELLDHVRDGTVAMGALVQGLVLQGDVAVTGEATQLLEFGREVMSHADLLDGALRPLLDAAAPEEALSGPGKDQGRAAALQMAKAASGDLGWVAECLIEDSLLTLRLWSSLSLSAAAALAIALLLRLLRSWELGWESSPPALGLLVLLPCASPVRAFLRWSCRVVYVSWILAVVLAGSLWTFFRAHGRSKRASEALWSRCHLANARLVREAADDLRGIMVKVAQLASVNAELPTEWRQELEPLQDDITPSSMVDVEAQLKMEFGDCWQDLIQLNTGPPLGSGAVAQVHRATVRVPGPDNRMAWVEGVVKVQHRGMASKVWVDGLVLRMASCLLGLVSGLSPLAKELSRISQDAVRMTTEELDFKREAENQELARASILALKLELLVPRIFPTLVTSQVIAMQYVEGTKITTYVSELPPGAKSEARCRQLMDELVHYYARTLLHGPVFSCDPHPGNILVEAGTGRLVLLDWGRVARLSGRCHRGCARFLLAIMMTDSLLLHEACRDLDLDLDPSMRSWNVCMATARVFFRDLDLTGQGPAAFDMQSMMGIIGSVSRADPLVAKYAFSGSKTMLRGVLLPLSLTVELLRQLAAQMGVTCSILSVLSRHALEFLIRESGYCEAAVSLSPTAGILLELPDRAGGPHLPKGSGPWPLGVTLEAEEPLAGFSRELECLLRDLHAGGHVLGAQVAVLDFETGSSLANLALGHTSWLQPDVVTTETYFNMTEVSKLFLAFAVLKQVEIGCLSLDHVITNGSWQKNKAGACVTLEQVLSHTSGCARFFLDEVASLRKMSAKSKAGGASGAADSAAAASAAQLLEPGQRQLYHHGTFGWLLARACHLIAGKDLAAVWEEFAEEALGPEEAGRLALTAPLSAGHGVRVALPCNEMQTPSLADLMEDLNLLSVQAELALKSRRRGASPEDKAAAALWTDFLNQRPMFEPSALQAELATHLPGLQAYSNAATVARALLATAQGRSIRNSTLLAEALKPHGNNKRCGEQIPLPPRLRRFENCCWGLGVELLGEPGPCKSSGTAQEHAWLPPGTWGHTAANGSFALVLPGRRPVVAVLLLNRGNSGVVADRVMQHIVKAVCLPKEDMRDAGTTCYLL